MKGYVVSKCISSDGVKFKIKITDIESEGVDEVDKIIIQEISNSKVEEGE